MKNLILKNLDNILFVLGAVLFAVTLSIVFYKVNWVLGGIVTAIELMFAGACAKHYED